MGQASTRKALFAIINLRVLVLVLALALPSQISAAGMAVSDAGMLRQTSTQQYPEGVWRTDFAQGDGVPPLFYAPQRGSCAANGMKNDGGSCVDADGGSWKAKFPDPDRIDVRQFGAIPDGKTPADTAVAAAIAYGESIKGCVYIPDVYPGFVFLHAIRIAADGCLIGGRIKGWVIGKGARPNSPPSNLHFPNDSDGIVGPDNGAGPYNCYVANLSLVGDAAQSKVATHTAGLNLSGFVDCKIENIFISNFVVCRQMSGPSSRLITRDIWCNDQQAYPNLINDFPFACVEMDHGAKFAAGAGQMTGDVCRAQSWMSETRADGNGSSTAFDIEKPRGGVPLWRADGIKVRVGPPTVLQNGQSELAGSLQNCGMGSGDGQYTVWDISAGGGGEGRQLLCTHTVAMVTAGNPSVAVHSTHSYRAGDNILAVADHGLPLADKVRSIDDATHLTLTKAPYVSGRLNLTLTEVNIAGGGGNGRKIEVRFAVAPPSGRRNVDITWIDPTGYAAYDITGASDYWYIRPMMIGGYDVALKHTGLSDGGVTFEPTYIELLNQCADIERPTYGDVAIFHRVMNPPIPDCPGYVDPSAGPTITAYNNVYLYRNGAVLHANPAGAAQTGQPRLR